MSRVVDIVRERLRVHGAYVRLFDTPDGKVVLGHLMRQGFVFNTTHVAGDPHTSAMNEGSRRLVLSILKHVHKDHKTLVNQLEQEIQNENT